MTIINLTTLKSAIVSALLMAALQVSGYILSVGDIFKIEWNALANIAVLSLVTGLVSVIKSTLTNEKGEFVGAVKVKE